MKAELTLEQKFPVTWHFQLVSYLRVVKCGTFFGWDQDPKTHFPSRLLQSSEPDPPLLDPCLFKSVRSWANRPKLPIFRKINTASNLQSLQTRIHSTMQALSLGSKPECSLVYINLLFVSILTHKHWLIAEPWLRTIHRIIKNTADTSQHASSAQSCSPTCLPGAAPSGKPPQQPAEKHAPPKTPWFCQPQQPAPLGTSRWGLWVPERGVQMELGSLFS